jgi:tol-pal system protein YbgF
MGVRLLPLVAALLVPATGCMLFTTKDEGRQLKASVDKLRSQVDGITQREQELRTATAEAKAQVARLHVVLEQATNLVQRNSADLGVQVQKIQSDLNGLIGKTAEIGHNLESISKQFTEYRAQTDVKLEGLTTKTASATAPPAPEGKDQLFDAAYKRYQQGQFEEARRLFRTFTTRFSRDERADNAQYWIGQSYYEERKYAAAITEFKKVLDNYPRSDAGDGAMYGMAFSFVELKYCTEGEAFLQDMVKRYPRSPLVDKAKKKLRELKRIKRNRRLCQT